MHQGSYPSTSHLFRLGATTFWEHWSGSYIDWQEGPHSHNHSMQGGLDAWLFMGVAGIRSAEQRAGFQHIFCGKRFMFVLQQETAAIALYHIWGKQIEV